jgi:hypothetical protein
MPNDEIKVAAFALGADTRWNWRIFTRDGRILLESQDTFANVAEALADGRRRVPDVAAGLTPIAPAETPRATDGIDPLSALRMREAERWF